MKQSNFNLYVIADALDHFRLMDDPYEYHDCEGVESIEDIAEHLFDVKYRDDVIQWLKEKVAFYSSDEELNTPDDTGKTMTEQCKYFWTALTLFSAKRLKQRLVLEHEQVL